MKLLSRREFLLGLGSLGLLGLINWDFVYGKVITPAGDADKDDPTAGQEKIDIECDFYLVNGIIIDGTGSPAYRGNLAIKGDRIVACGNFVPQKAERTIDVSGLRITPGFIDLHTHTEGYWAAGGKGEMFLKQGVTTQIGGNCGTSVPSLGEYLASVKHAAINVGMFAGYKTLRRQVISREPVQANNAQIQSMKSILEQEMKEGAFGLSVGLSYSPQDLATAEELIELCRAIKPFGGFYSTHIRNEGDYVIPFLQEAIDIGFAARVPVEYSHVKAAGEKNWGKMKVLLQMMEKAHNEGLDITGDVYGYNFSSLDTAADQIQESMSEDDLIMALKHRLIMIGSDSYVDSGGEASHPRAFGNYARILGYYVRDRKILTLEKAVHKMTAMPAKRLGLKGRGIIKPGNKADLAVFSLAGIRDVATREEPNCLSTGMKYVFINGKQALDQGKLTGILGGIPLRNNG